MTYIPAFLQDNQDLLTEQGFISSQTWYHGTSSALVESIVKNGLIRSGDTQLNEAAKKTMATIGNQYAESTEPVFLTQSKALAYYWAEQTVRTRSVRIDGTEAPVVFSVSLNQDVNLKVKPDVGAASLLLLDEGKQYMEHLAELYQARGITPPEVDLMRADRLAYLDKLGMAYIDENIQASCLTLLKA